MGTSTTALEVADYLIWLARKESEEEPGYLTPLQLQKLLYFVQGWTLAEWGAPMFRDEIEAWKNGPVVPGVWKLMSGKSPITAEIDPPPPLTDADKSMVHSVWNAYKKYSPFALRDLTHSEEAPYLEAYVPDKEGRCTRTISRERMKDWFVERARLVLDQAALKRDRAAAFARWNLAQINARKAV
jgi:uncharacterized phage-associated protein